MTCLPFYVSNILREERNLHRAPESKSLLLATFLVKQRQQTLKRVHPANALDLATCFTTEERESIRHNGQSVRKEQCPSMLATKQQKYKIIGAIKIHQI